MGLGVGCSLAAVELPHSLSFGDLGFETSRLDFWRRKAIPKVNITAVRSAVLQCCSLQPAEFTRVRRKQQQRGGRLMMHSHLQAAHVSAALGARSSKSNPAPLYLRICPNEAVSISRSSAYLVLGSLSTCFFHANLHPPLFAHCISCCIQLHPINPKIRKAQSDDR